jgi:sugar lactone lactonase YvrE
MDGMRCDVAGNLYVTRYGKGVVAKLSPQGEVLLEIALNGTKPSNITFGGSDGCTCYVTEVDHGRIEVFRAALPGRLTPP